jgi:hypothetical protein
MVQSSAHLLLTAALLRPLLLLLHRPQPLQPQPLQP